MCRLAGFIKLKQFKKTDNQWLFDTYSKVLVNAEAGGSHATGWACVIDKSPVVRKDKIPATEFVKTDMHKELLGLLPETRIVIGHTRFKTQGDNKYNRNNHPLLSKESGLIVAHNGCITNYDELVKKHNIKTDGEVDSEIILRMIETHNGDYEKAFQEMRGSFTFTMLDINNPNMLQIFRHTNGMNFIFVEEKNVIFFATTAMNVTNELKTYKHKLFKKEIDYMESSAKDDTLYSFDLKKETKPEFIDTANINIPVLTFASNYNSNNNYGHSRYGRGGKSIQDNYSGLATLFGDTGINQGSVARNTAGNWKQYKLDGKYLHDDIDNEHLHTLQVIGRNLRVVGTTFFIRLVKEKLIEWKTIVNGFQQHEISVYKRQLIITPAETGKKSSTNDEYNMRRNSKKLRKNILNYLSYVERRIESRPNGGLHKKYDDFITEINHSVETKQLIQTNHINCIGNKETEQQQLLLNRPVTTPTSNDSPEINEAVRIAKGVNVDLTLDNVIEEHNNR